MATANARSIQLVDFIEAPVGLYTTSEHSTSMRSWSDLVGKNDVIIVTANVSLSIYLKKTMLKQY